MNVDLRLGDCLDVMASMEENSIDAIVTDPPYGLRFMGKDWDHGVPGIPFWRECARVAKPGAHLLAFGGTRTHHRLMCAIEDAGWEIRDTVMWVYGQGFPKSLDVSKAIDRAAGAEREIIGSKLGQPGYSLAPERPDGTRGNVYEYSRSGSDPQAECSITAPKTTEAMKWQGWGTALKPAWEPIILARKPLEGTVAENVQRWGAGALNIDGCRAGTESVATKYTRSDGGHRDRWEGNTRTGEVTEHIGRWPANLIHDGSEEVLAGFPLARSSGYYNKGAVGIGEKSGPASIPIDGLMSTSYNDIGSAARFFYCAKASRSERGNGNNHPTVKPLALMRYLCRLITPPDGLILDPFMGSGSTGIGAIQEGFNFIGIERDQSSYIIACDRIKSAELQMSLPMDVTG